MSYADKVFKENCKTILNTGTITPAARAVWADGNPAHTIKSFGIINEYDLQKEFPIMTLRPTGFKNCIDEILWIYQKKSNNVNDLNSHIWDEWADVNGSIGSAYGWQVANKLRPTMIKVNYDENLTEAVDQSEVAISCTYEKVFLDQTDFVLNELKENKFSRRILTNLYDIDDLNKMGLEPCAYSLTLNVTKGDKGGYKYVLNAILNQRSQDMFVANNWNVVQYAALVHLFAQVSGYEVGKLIHVIADAHIYDKHIPLVREMIELPEYDAPNFWINTEKTNFYDFTIDDFVIEEYKTNKQIKNIPVAV